MKILNIYKNHHYDDRKPQIFTEAETAILDTTAFTIEDYLLGNIKSQTREKLFFVPETYANAVEVDLMDYLLNYLGLGFWDSKLQNAIDRHYNEDGISYRKYMEKKSRQNLKRQAYMQNMLSRVCNNNYIEVFIADCQAFKIKFPNKKDWYTISYIPKHNGKRRKLTIPIQELMELQHKALRILNIDLKIKSHNSAHAYITKRSNVTNAMMHKYSNHIVAYDLKDFFPNTNRTFLRTSLYSTQVFSIIDIVPQELILDISQNTTNANNHQWATVGYKAILLLDAFIDNLLDIALYEDGLPQGSPLSPTLSNIGMRIIDHTIVKTICSNKKLSKTKLIYTRYADDLCFSSLRPIKLDKITAEVEKILHNNNQKYKLNPEKTKYLKPSYKCYVTGVKINEKHELTFGHEKTALLKQSLFKLFLAKKNGQDIKEQAQQILGVHSYAQSIEPNHMKLILDKYCKKFNIVPKTVYKYFLK